jgi:predicted nuclease with TOPRIM domain
MNDLISKLKHLNTSLNDQIAELVHQLRNNASKLVHEATKEFFEKHGDVVECIFWTQYTPYFNDGEACRFRVGEVFVTLKNDPNWCEYEGSYLYNDDELKDLELQAQLKLLWDKDRLAAANAYRQHCIEQKGYDPFIEKRYSYKTTTTQEQLETWEPYHSNIEEIYEFAKHISPELRSDFYELKSIIEHIDENIMERLFGNHIKVVITSNKLYTEEYDHD